MKVAMIGLGGMGFVHYKAYKNNPDTEVVAVCDVRRDILEKKTAGDDVRLYSDYKEMLEKEKVDIVDICSPSYMHAEHTIAALESGANVLCEKPMALNEEDCQKMIEAAKKSGKLFMVAHVVRFMQSYVYLREVIKSEKHGKLIHLDMKRISSIPTWSWENWMQQEEKSGLVMYDLVVHDIDYVQSVFGMPEDICGVYYDMKENNCYANVNYIYGNFAVSIVGTFYKAKTPFESGVRAVFENGYLNIQDGKIIENGEEVVLEEVETSGETGINLSNADGYAAEIEYFIDCVKNAKKPEMSMPESAARSIILTKLTKERLTKM